MSALWAEAERAVTGSAGVSPAGTSLTGSAGVPPAPKAPAKAGEMPALAAKPPLPSTSPSPASLATAPQKIAIIGMAGVMPQCDDLDEFWNALVTGRDLITEAPRERWDWTKFAAAPAPGARYGGFIRNPDQFDAAFFGVSPLEAKLMDPQQRLFLQTVWHTIEDAGYRPADLARSKTAVFVGVSTSDYFEAMREAGAEIDAHTSTGFAHCLLANRVSFLFDWRGPSQIIDTACSSSLIALHRAAQAIAAGDCTTALVGGVNLLLTPTMFLSFAKAGMLSPDGRCQTFDRRANGYVRGEGVGAVLLKPLAQAEADGDHIHAVILATAENHGGRATSLTAPNPAVQAEMLVQAYRSAHIDPRTVSYVETHGTGTALGDPIEFTGLQRAFAQLEREIPATTADSAPRCWLGSVKTNIGHLESAAGIAGLLKVVLALRHRQIPPNLHFRDANPHLEFSGTRFAVPTHAAGWQAPRIRHDPASNAAAATPRRAGVSSFGFGGAYAHAVLEEYASGTALRAATPTTEPEYVLISAPSLSQLNELLDRWHRCVGAWLNADEGSAPSLRDIAATSRFGRVAHRCRIAFRVHSLNELQTLLASARTGEADPRLLRGETPAGDEPGSGFVGESGATPEMGDRAALVRRWCAGEAIAWSRADARRAPLPLYPFRKARHWFAPAAVDQRLAIAPPPTAQQLQPRGEGTPPTTERAGGDMLAFEPQWIATPLELHRTDATIALLGTPEVVTAFRATATKLAANGFRVRWVTCADAYRDANGAGLTIDARSVEPVAAAISQLRCEGCHHLLILSESLLPALSTQVSGGAIFKEQVASAVHLAFRLIQAAAHEAAGQPGPHLAYACHASSSIDSVREEAVAALLASAYQERGDLIGHAIQFHGSGLDAAAVLRAAIAETAADADEPREIRYQGSERVVRRLCARSSDAGPGLHLQHGATYLLAGALGEVGARFSSWLAREYAARVVILGRRPAGAEINAQLQSLASGSGRITYRQADITDEDALRCAVAEIVTTHGAIRGVFHLARTVEAGTLGAKDEAAFDRVTAAKVEGTIQLDAATADQPLDFFVLFSSIAGDWGLGGAGDYSYACRFQTAFAEVRQRWVEAGHRSGRSIAVGWPQWRYDAHSHAERDAFLESRGFTLLEADRAFAWLAHGIDPRRTASTFVLGDGSRLSEMLTPAGRKRALTSSAAAESDDERAVRELLAEMSAADLDQLYAAEFGAAGPATSADVASLVAERVAVPSSDELRTTIRKLLGTVLQHAPESIGGTVPFERLGMDSILGVRVVQRLEQALGITVPPRWLIENSTVDTLAQKIRSAWPPGQGAGRR